MSIRPLLAFLLVTAAALAQVFQVSPSCPDPSYGGLPGGDNTMVVNATGVTIGNGVSIGVRVVPCLSAYYVVEASIAEVTDVGPGFTIYADWTTALSSWNTGCACCQIYAKDYTILSGAGFCTQYATQVWTCPNNSALIGYFIAFQAFVACSGCPYGVAPTNAWGTVIQ